ncbi:MAG: DNA-formamidopyrimidine glycosylase family protein [Acidimicrobiales bacterium]
MPELIEVEMYRQVAAATVGRTIATIDAPDAWYLKRGATAEVVTDALVGAVVERVERHGKVLLVHLDRDVVVGLRFGMTGRLLVDGRGPIAELLYGSPRNDPAWNRFACGFTDGGTMVVSDPRRLGGVELNPEIDRLGPDAATISTGALRARLRPSRAPLKAALLDQHRVAGLGNLLVDETLWRAGLAPTRVAGDLDDAAVRGLAGRIRSTVGLLTRRGGSHTGDLQVERRRGGRCPRCGMELRRDVVGTRTTYWCSTDQH